MKFSVLQENLSKGLQTVYRAIPTKSALPILSNVLIVAENGEIKLSATNMETAISTKVRASIEKDGAVTIPAKLLKEFVANLSPSTIVAELMESMLHLKSDKTKSKLNGTNFQDFPQLPKIPETDKFIEIDPKVLEHAASYVTFAAGSDSSRPLFTGVYLNAVGNKLTIAATDGFRLSEKVMEIKNNLGDVTTIIPAKTFLEIAKIFSSSQEPIKFVLNETENLALFESEGTMVATRLLDGQYPDYKRIVPVDKIISATFSSQDFIEAVKLTNIFAKESNNTIKVGFDVEEGQIKIVSLVEETGEHESTLNAEVEGENIDIAFNSKYLLDFLNNIKTEKIVFMANGNTTPCMLKVPDQADFYHVIMPVQL